MKVIVGLGNIGTKYDMTYHNLGFRAVDEFAEKIGAKFHKVMCNGIVAETNINGEKIILVKPNTYMNNSGLCVKNIVDKFKVELKDLIVVYDDIDLLVGTFRFRTHGSSGTHNGMRSVVEYLDSIEFARVRIGIDSENKRNLVDYVLSKISKTHNEQITNIMPEIIKTISDFVGIE